MNTLAWRIKKWYVCLQLRMLRRRLRVLRRGLLRRGRPSRTRQLDLPFRG